MVSKLDFSICAHGGLGSTLVSGGDRIDQFLMLRVRL